MFRPGVQPSVFMWSDDFCLCQHYDSVWKTGVTIDSVFLVEKVEPHVKAIFLPVCRLLGLAQAIREPPACGASGTDEEMVLSGITMEISVAVSPLSQGKGILNTESQYNGAGI